MRSAALILAALAGCAAPDAWTVVAAPGVTLHAGWASDAERIGQIAEAVTGVEAATTITVVESPWPDPLVPGQIDMGQTSGGQITVALTFGGGTDLSALSSAVAYEACNYLLGLRTPQSSEALTGPCDAQVVQRAMAMGMK